MGVQKLGWFFGLRWKKTAFLFFRVLAFCGWKK
jgi:hypothetical protein